MRRPLYWYCEYYATDKVTITIIPGQGEIISPMYWGDMGLTYYDLSDGDMSGSVTYGWRLHDRASYYSIWRKP